MPSRARDNTPYRYSPNDAAQHVELPAMQLFVRMDITAGIGKQTEQAGGRNRGFDKGYRQVVTTLVQQVNCGQGQRLLLESAAVALQIQIALIPVRRQPWQRCGGAP